LLIAGTSSASTLIARVGGCTFEGADHYFRESEMTAPASDVPPPEQPTGPVATPPPPAPVPAPPSANAGWAVVALLFFWPLSFSAFTHSFNVYPLWASGNVAGAQYASDRVRRLGQLSLWLFGGLLLLFLIVYTIVAVVFITQGDSDFGRYHDYKY
jgi:hypothetical protein